MDAAAPMTGGRIGRAVSDAAVCFALLLCGAIMKVVVSIDRYDAISYKSHASAIRRGVPWRVSSVALVMPALAVATSMFAYKPTAIGWLLTVITTLALAEVFSVCLHRESYIAAFEPWNIPTDARPLGGTPSRPADRRLHYLVRTQLLYVSAIVTAGILADFGDVRAQLVTFCFVVKYIPATWGDYEAYFHWDMHTNVLRMQSTGTRLERLWRLTIELLLGPLVGALPWVYSTEHLRLHHPYNAGPRDVHSPLPFDRWSALQFIYFALQSTWRLSVVIHICQRPQVTRFDRFRLGTGCAAYWLVTVCLVIWSPALGAWLLLGPAYRGINTAVSQYVWHGVQKPNGDSAPTSTTILWVPPHSPRLMNGDVVEAPTEVEGHPSWSSSMDGPEAVPGREWAFFDNYHLLHHLHPRAHFVEYPRLLARDADRVASSAAAVIDLAGYRDFFSNLMITRFIAIADAVVAPSMSTSELVARLESWAPVRSPICERTRRRTGQALEPIAAAVWTGAWTSRRSRSRALAGSSTTI